MEELFQLILALFVLSFPLLSILSRRRRAGRTRRAESPAPRSGRGWRRLRRGGEGGEAAEGAEREAAAEDTGEVQRPEAGARPGLEARGRSDGSAGASSRPRQAADATWNSQIGRGGSAGRPRRPQDAALERIALRSRLQQAVIWAEVLGKPKALRRTSDPWDDEGSL